MEEVLLSMEHITKVYPNGFMANKDVSFSVNKGEIHALSGENGAGKSTLMKILFGEEQAEQGRILYKGKEIRPENSIAAIKLGIGMVHQHFMLVPSFTVAENMVLGMEPGRFGRLDRRAAVRVTREIAEKYGFQIDPLQKVGNLPVGQKQKVEILKALLRGAELLILDEPTAVLTPQETAELFEQITRLKEKGHTLIFISHKLGEIKRLCDRITVLRGGRSVGTHQVSEVTEADISRMMVGRDVLLNIQKKPARPGDTVLQVRNLRLSEKADGPGVSFDLRSGEILGIAGVEGNGQTELAQCLSGLRRYSSGTVRLMGKDIKGASVRKIRELGLSHVPEDRMSDGCSLEASVVENLFSTVLYKKAYQKGLILNRKLLGRKADMLIEEYRIQCSEKDEPVRMLSGGNMQKVVVAREFGGRVSVVLANQPTRGIDVGATEFIRLRLIALRDEGAAVLLISADLGEVLEVSDSLLVFQEHSVCAYFPDASQVKEEVLGEYMLGLRRMETDEIGGVLHEADR